MSKKKTKFRSLCIDGTPYLCLKEYLDEKPLVSVIESLNELLCMIPEELRSSAVFSIDYSDYDFSIKYTDLETDEELEKRLLEESSRKISRTQQVKDLMESLGVTGRI